MSQSRIYVESQLLKTFVILGGFVLVMAVLGMRLYKLQVLEADEMQHKAQQRALRSWILPAPRGDIIDREGNPLAVSMPRWNVYADPTYMTNKLEATVLLSDIIDVPRKELREHFEKRSNGRLLAKKVTDAQSEEIKALKLDGVYTRRTYERIHPTGSVAPHVIGFVLDSGIGGAGIEQYYQTSLCATDGWEKFYVDSRGRPMYHKERQVQPGQSGAHIQLNLIAPIQRKAEQALRKSIEHHKATSGAVIVVRPTDGAVVAMASWPHFDLNAFTEADPEQYRNQALQFVYESGSTMKPLIAGAAVADGLAQFHEKIFCENGRWTYRHGRARRTIHDHSFKHGGHQYLTVSEGIAKSDNILMAKLGLRIGPERLHAWIKHFGFGQLTGIELPGEDSGIILPKRRWNQIGSCMSVPMGHELAVTPLQMVMMHAAVANGGVWNPPRLVHSIYRVNRETGVKEYLPLDEPPKARRVYPKNVAREIRMAMNETMTNGTGRKLQIAGFSSAGKTGTTEKLVDVVDERGRTRKVYSKDNHIGSFVCFAPASDQAETEFVCLAVIDDPQENGHYGSQTAGPIVQDVLGFALEHVHSKADQVSNEALARRGE